MSTTKARKILYERSGNVCEICGCARATNAQHRVNKSQGGSWALSNLIHVCGSGSTGCHGYIHSHPERSYANGWSVRQSMNPRHMPALLKAEHGLLQYMWLYDDGTKDAVDMASALADGIALNRTEAP